MRVLRLVWSFDQMFETKVFPLSETADAGNPNLLTQDSMNLSQHALAVAFSSGMASKYLVRGSV